MKLETSKTVGEIAVELPQTIPYFEERGIDYCCGGGKSLKEACVRAGVEVGEAVQALESIAGKTQEADTSQWPTITSLVQYLMDKHHAYTREQLALVGKLGAKVLAVHGLAHPELGEINEVVHDMTEELLHHLLKEEQVAFPVLKGLEGKGDNAGQPFPYPVFRMGPQQILMGDHETTGEQLAELRHLTQGYTPPGNACVTYRAFYRGLKDLEEDLHKHIHLENNVLFPMVERRAGSRTF